MPLNQIIKIGASLGANIWFARTERGNVADDIRMDTKRRRFIEQLDQIAPALAELAQQAINVTARRFSLVRVFAAQDTDQLDQPIALAVPEV